MAKNNSLINIRLFMEALKKLLHLSAKALYLAIAIAVLLFIALRVMPLFGSRLPELPAVPTPTFMDRIFGKNIVDDTTNEPVTEQKKKYLLDLLPDPGSLRILGTSTTPTETTNLYVHNNVNTPYGITNAGYYNGGVNVQYYEYRDGKIVVVDGSGKEVVDEITVISNNGDITPRLNVIKNLNIVSEQSVYPSFTMYGSILNSYFYDGYAPFIIGTRGGEQVIAQGFYTSEPGFAGSQFARFKLTVPSNITWPKGANVPCVLILYANKNTSPGSIGSRVIIPVSCRGY